jgi:mRNA-degrading endonuclease RelE of RelBE toxin-antitoxin system
MRILTSRVFLRRLRELLKTYPGVISDIAPTISSLKKGETPGDRIPRVKGRPIFKVRIPNHDAQSGKSGGYRMLYYLVDREERLLLTIYSKTEQSDISTEELVRIVEEWEQQHA